jgi:Cobalamin biosynthesis protein CobD/CbiB
MEFNLLQISIITIFLAILIDLVFSEPKGLIHVAISSGRFAAFLSRHIPGKKELFLWDGLFSY